MDTNEVKKAIDDIDEIFKVSLKDRIVGKCRSAKHRFFTLWKFVKLGWNDYDWDECYLLLILESKLSSMYNFFNSDLVMCVDGKKKAEEIKIALDACKRLLEDEYQIKALASLDEKWGKTEIVFGEKNEKGNTPISFSRPNIKNEEDEKEEREEFANRSKIAENEREKDNELLFDTMKKYNLGWWD